MDKTNTKKLFPTNWHTYAFDVVFIILNFTFFPLIGNQIVRWFDLWLVGKGKGILLAIFSLAILGVLAYMGLVIALYLKRFPIQVRHKDFKSGENLALLNLIAVFSTLWFLFVGIIEFLRIVIGDENLYFLIAIGIFIFLICLALIYFAYRLFLRLDKPLTESEELQKKKHNWRFDPLTEFFANLSLFTYIFLLQCFYYAYISEMIGERLSGITDPSDDSFFFIGGMILVFLFLYAAPRMIYLKGIDEKGNTLIMLIVVFISTIIGQFLPDYLSWLF